MCVCVSVYGQEGLYIKEGADGRPEERERRERRGERECVRAFITRIQNQAMADGQRWDCYFPFSGIYKVQTYTRIEAVHSTISAYYVYTGRTHYFFFFLLPSSSSSLTHAHGWLQRSRGVQTGAFARRSGHTLRILREGKLEPVSSIVRFSIVTVCREFGNTRYTRRGRYLHFGGSVYYTLFCLQFRPRVHVRVPGNIGFRNYCTV